MATCAADSAVERAKERLLVAFGVGAFVQIAVDQLHGEGTAWTVVQIVTAVAVTGFLVAWMRLAFRAGGGFRTWLAPALMAAGAAGVMIGLALLIG